MLRINRPERDVSAGEGTHPERVLIPGGTVRMGSDRHCPEEAPARRVAEPVDTSTSHVGFRCVVRERWA
jgi:sulfatase modifying factor 1